MNDSTYFMNDSFEQDSYDDFDHGLDSSYDEFIFEQFDEVDSEGLDMSDLDDLGDEDDNFDGVF